MRLLSGGSPRASSTRYVGVLPIAAGILIVALGLTLVVMLAAAALVIGGGVFLVRRLTGRGLLRSRAQAAPSLELAADFEILPAQVREDARSIEPTPNSIPAAPPER